MKREGETPRPKGLKGRSGMFNHGFMSIDMEEHESRLRCRCCRELGSEYEVFRSWNSPALVNVPREKSVKRIRTDRKTCKRCVNRPRPGIDSSAELERGSNAKHVEDWQDENRATPPPQEARAAAHIAVLLVHLTYLNNAGRQWLRRNFRVSCHGAVQFAEWVSFSFGSAI
jgi:hypothetical protein